MAPIRNWRPDITLCESEYWQVGSAVVRARDQSPWPPCTKVTLYKHKNMEQVGRNYLLLPNSFSIELECAHVVGTQHFKLQYNTLYRD